MTMGTFKGIVEMQNGKATLNANGVIVNLDGEATLFEPFLGSFITLNGEQHENTIINPVPVNETESAAESSDDDSKLRSVLKAVKDLQQQFGVAPGIIGIRPGRSEEHTSELQSQSNLVCRLLLEKK